MNGITFIPEFINHAGELYQFLHDHADWDTSMLARKTVSYGKAYNYSQMRIPPTDTLNGRMSLTFRQIS
ncbi:hypothetical protein [[Flexibacter] sp. ATCC 35208]|uniref:hypothetical protein n=1 Tax=[Flexibacter] sp. ATCC 35208 TaxID=1936242 RepID=UPI0009D4DAB4|nr:hypothetical protein [[Flexibacter] sp. ATCC 35208]OMP78091.1 hypothetical protein BW716_16825 [[Flexibacter] sp. ATCC 35208]